MMEMNEIEALSQKLLNSEFGEDTSHIIACYKLEEAGGTFLLFEQNNAEICTMWNTDGEMAGLQPLPYVKEYGEKLW